MAGTVRATLVMERLWNWVKLAVWGRERRRRRKKMMIEWGSTEGQ